jgi:hypothetical protein
MQVCRYLKVSVRRDKHQENPAQANPSSEERDKRRGGQHGPNHDEDTHR